MYNHVITGETINNTLYDTQLSVQNTKLLARIRDKRKINGENQQLGWVLLERRWYAAACEECILAPCDNPSEHRRPAFVPALTWWNEDKL